jgi:hypothetical protein
VTDEYTCLSSLNLFKTPKLEGLVTQAAALRHLQLGDRSPDGKAIAIRLCEDGYGGWIDSKWLGELEPARQPYRFLPRDRADIEAAIPDIVAFCRAAMATPNEYLWGGTVAPNYDCSGLMQAAFAASGIWLPRDSYQQESFTRRIEMKALLPGDLVFFGERRVDHVGLYLGEGNYLHSSGKEMGRNGIAIDPLDGVGDGISRRYFQKYWSSGRVTASYCPSLAA